MGPGSAGNGVGYTWVLAIAAIGTGSSRPCEGESDFGREESVGVVAAVGRRDEWEAVGARATARLRRERNERDRRIDVLAIDPFGSAREFLRNLVARPVRAARRTRKTIPDGR
jgi:hypothetical protein